MDKKKSNFLIVSPRQAWGGSIVLHALCKYLCELGYEASIVYVGDMNYKKGHKLKFWIKHIIYTLEDLIKEANVRFFGEKKYQNNPKYKGYTDVAVKGCKRKVFPIATKKTIVVYPDRVYGNFMRAKHVVRWFLYHNRFENDAYGINDMFVTYRDVFNDCSLNPENFKLYITHYDLKTYRRYNFGDRSGVCYVIRKGSQREDLPKQYDGPIVDDLTEAEKVKIFNETEYCILYDTQTSYSKLAALCGCISVVIPEPGKNRFDYRSPDEVSYGEAFGFAETEIDFAISTRDKLLEEYRMENTISKANVNEFATKCLEYFGKSNM